jgi:asparagine synthetase B (glutamine-hydrolysing)
MAGERVDRALALIGAGADGLLPHVMGGVFSDEMLGDLVRGTAWERPARDHLDEARDDARRIWSGARDPYLALSLYQLRHSLPQDILAKVDRMSMAESLEVRAPFLDSRLAAYCLALPPQLKVRGDLGKYVLRTALRGRLPRAVVGAPKRGFAMPVRDWLEGPFWRCLRDEVQAYRRDGGSELDGAALAKRTTADEMRCRVANDYRAVHRAFLLYGFLRWRRMLGARSPAPQPT